MVSPGKRTDVSHLNRSPRFSSPVMRNIGAKAGGQVGGFDGQTPPGQAGSSCRVGGLMLPAGPVRALPAPRVDVAAGRAGAVLFRGVEAVEHRGQVDLDVLELEVLL